MRRLTRVAWGIGLEGLVRFPLRKVSARYGEKTKGGLVAKGFITGMLGVYLVAAELSRLSLIVSPTSRSAAGADLLVTDEACQMAWSVQVKTNGKAAGFWLVGKSALTIRSPSHVYVFVNLQGDMRPDYIVAHSEYVANHTKTSVSSTGAVWYEFHKKDQPYSGEGWKDVFLTHT